MSLSQFRQWIAIGFLIQNCFSTGTVVLDSHGKVSNPPQPPIALDLVPEKEELYNQFLVSLFAYQFSQYGYRIQSSPNGYKVRVSYSIQKLREVKSFYILTDPYGFHTTSIQSYDLYRTQVSLQVFHPSGELVWTGIASEENTCPSLVPNTPRIVVTLVRYFLKEHMNSKINFPPWDSDIRKLKQNFSYVDFSC